MKQINKVKWYKTTERKPTRDCYIILLNYVIEGCGVCKSIIELKWSMKYQAQKEVIRNEGEVFLPIHS